MARKPRQFSDTGIYHVMLRGNERKNIFQDDGHKRRFLDGIDAKRKEADFAVYAYCIMDNHVHLLINIKEQDLSSIMKGIAVRYAVFYNWHQSRVGHVFSGPFQE
jgi:putative transposase